MNRPDSQKLVVAISVIIILLAVTVFFQERTIRELKDQTRQQKHTINDLLVSHDYQLQQLHEQENRIVLLENRIQFMKFPKIDYYAYGDSITKSPGAGSDSDESGCYIEQMKKMFDPGAVALYNKDGAGMDSGWGLDNLESHYHWTIRYFFYMFTNDAQRGLSDQQTIDNYLKIYNITKSKGSTPVPCIMILTSRPWNSEYTLENQTRRINSLQNALDERGIFYVKMYDALDSQPFNGRLDAYNDTYLLDGVHPDQNGHTKMAQYLWISLNKQPLNGR